MLGNPAFPPVTVVGATGPLCVTVPPFTDLHDATKLGIRKTRAMAQWADLRGFRTSIIERAFEGNFHVNSREPPVALLDVDNVLARQGIESVGFDELSRLASVAGRRISWELTCMRFPGRGLEPSLRVNRGPRSTLAPSELQRDGMFFV